MTSIRKYRALMGSGLGLVASVLTAAALLELPGNAKAATSDAVVAAPAVMVTVTTLRPRDINIWEEFSGRLEAVNFVQVRSRVAGVIQSVDFREGSLVKKGDLLFTIDPAPYQAA